MKRTLQRTLWLMVAAAGAGAVLMAALLAIALSLLQPTDDDWQTTITVGPWQRAVSLPVLLRFASHPLGLSLLDGRIVHTPLGRWQLHRERDGLSAVCAPCTLRWQALGPQPLKLARVRASVRPGGADRISGELRVGEGVHELLLHANGRITPHGAELALRMPPTPAARVVAVLGRDLPEAAQLQLSGTIGGTLQLRWPDGQWQLQPAIEGLEVSGLHTERLLDAQLPAACRTGGGETDALAPWLARALVAAEDARFFEHPGYDLAEMLAALRHNDEHRTADGDGDGDAAAAPARWRGGSTLTQQLAKFAFTGDDRSATRKLRELLYAVEMERTLGKARILQLYLALAPWGDGVCGASRAAQAYLGKPAAKLGPVASAWLVSLLRNPDAQLAALAEERRIDRERLRQILLGMRPMAAAQRELALSQLDDWSP
jgi:hypothetical protein